MDKSMIRKRNPKNPSAKQSKKPASNASNGSVIGWSMLSALLLAASFAPVNFSWAAWVAPIGWLVLVEREQPPRASGYFWLWVSGCVFWLLNLHSIRLAFWALIFGWLALSLYLAVYTPLFVAVSRAMRQRWGWPLWIAAPVTWVGLDVVRSFLITGYAAGQLGHTQAHLPVMIQIADQFGGYGVTFVIMLSSVAIYQTIVGWRANKLQTALAPVSVAAFALLGTLAYGWWRLNEADSAKADRKPLLRVALIQENTPSMFDGQSEQRSIEAWVRYKDTTRQSAVDHGIADVVVWPESTFTAGVPWIESQLQDSVPDVLANQNVDLEKFNTRRKQMLDEFNWKVQAVLAAARNQNDIPNRETALGANEAKPFLLLGCDALRVSKQDVQNFNSAVFMAPTGEYLDRYDKMHLVMFGEYIPLGPVFKFLSDAFGLGSITPGKDVKCFEIQGVKVAPSICFETMLPELISWQVRSLNRSGKSPELLVNVTNDSWFRGTSMLDHHLACSIFCAVENRRPLLVAANTGLTAVIDGSGRVVQVTKRLQRATLLAEPIADSRWGLVQSAGYPLAWLSCLVVSAMILQSVARLAYRGKKVE
jgi:apolipoprotein N-acyltransferase